MKKLLYFGCIGEPGHYFFEPGERSITFSHCPSLYVDGQYTPKEDRVQGSAREVVVDECRIVAWHDFTGDQRAGSNSALLGYGYYSAAEMLADAKEQYPTVMKRQPGPLNFIDG